MTREFLSKAELSLLLGDGPADLSGPDPAMSGAEAEHDLLAPADFGAWERLLIAHFLPGSHAWSVLFEREVSLTPPSIALVSPASLRDMGPVAIAECELGNAVSGRIYCLLPVPAAALLARLVPGSSAAGSGFADTHRRGFSEAVKYLFVEFRSNLLRATGLKIGTSMPRIYVHSRQSPPEGDHLIEARMQLSIGDAWSGEMALWAELPVVRGILAGTGAAATRPGVAGAAPAPTGRSAGPRAASGPPAMPDGEPDPPGSFPGEPEPEPAGTRPGSGAPGVTDEIWSFFDRPDEAGEVPVGSGALFPPRERPPDVRAGAATGAGAGAPGSEPDETDGGLWSLEGPRAVRPPGSEEAGSEVELRVLTVEVGRATLTTSQVNELALGQLIPLDRLAGESVDLFIDQDLVARGEVVVVSDALGVKVTQVFAHRWNRRRTRTSREGSESRARVGRVQ